VSGVVLYLEFAKIGLFAVGGGLATLPFLYRLADKAAWLNAAEIPSMLAVAQLLPGAVGINLAAYSAAAVSAWMAYLAALGMITPQIIIICVISRLYNEFNRNAVVERVFRGLKAAATGLLAAAALQVISKPLYNAAAARVFERVRLREALIFCALFILIRFLKKLHPAVFILSAGAAGLALGL
jgi:chromate transporter